MQIKLNNSTVSVYETPCAFVAIYECAEEQVCVELDAQYVVKSIRPLGLDLSACNAFSVAVGKKVIVEFENEKPLFLFTYAQEQVNPADYTYYFEPGEHRTEEIELKKGESLYIAGGAVLRTHIVADGADGIRIAGRGILDTNGIGRKRRRMLRMIECDGAQVRDITLIGALDWAIVPIHCDGVEITGANVISWEVNGDGIDVVGCKNVHISDCFLHCADDCLCIKCNDYDDDRGCNNCENVLAEKCVLWNTRPGNAMEIGFETRGEEIKNIKFSDCDVLHCEYEGWQSGGVFTIHNGDRAHVHDVTYENIRVENAEQKLFDFKVYFSHYSKDPIRGFIDHIRVRDVFVHGDDLPPSIFRGCDNDHGIKDVQISGLYHNGKKLSSKLQAHIIAESGSEVEFV